MVHFLVVLKIIYTAGIVEDSAVMMLIVYLTDVWGLGITHAAGLINIWIGLTKLMPLIYLFLMNHYIGSYWMLVVSTTASALGMGFLSISTPSWLYSRISGSCRECITETQQSLFYFALILIMIGRSARDVTMETLNFKDNILQDFMRYFLTSELESIALQATLLVLTPWSIMFGISSACSLIAVFLLMDKSWSQKLYIDDPERSPVTDVLRVIGRKSYCSSLRFLKKAAILPPIASNLQAVEDAETIVRMLPVGVMFAFLVLISTIGSTYFLQQAKRLKPMTILGFEFLNGSYLLFLFLKEAAGKKLKYTNMNENRETLLHKSVTDALISAMMCCVMAALFEKSRLGVIRKHGLANKPEEIIPMSILWVIPQFFILRYLNESLVPILRMYLAEDMSLPMKNLKIFVFEGFVGAGIISSVLLVYLVGKVTNMGGRPNWFQHDTENSRLDLFYCSLAVLCVLVITIWFQVPRYFNKRRYPDSWQQPLVSNNRHIHV